MKEHYDVIIATPGRDLTAGYTRSLTETLEVLSDLGITYKWINDYFSIVHVAREYTLDAGYLFDEDKEIDWSAKGPMRDKVTYNKIFLIDSDIAWNVGQFMKLYNSDLDIVSGIYLRADAIPAFYPKDFEKYKDKDITNSTEIIEANALGMGFMCIKSGVFEKLERPWFKPLPSKYFQDDVEVEILLGEDTSWCRRVQELGYATYADLGVKLFHYKVIPIG